MNRFSSRTAFGIANAVMFNVERNRLDREKLCMFRYVFILPDFYSPLTNAISAFFRSQREGRERNCAELIVTHNFVTR